MNIRKLTMLSMLLAFSLIIFTIESQIPPIAPIPGIKLGLANIITLVVLVRFGKKEAFTVLILRIILSNIFAGGVVGFIYSVFGGIMCFVFMSLTISVFGEEKIWLVSIVGAISHNIGQILAAAMITQTLAIFWYFPILFVSGVIMGAFTGLSAKFILKHLTKITERNRG